MIKDELVMYCDKCGIRIVEGLIFTILTVPEKHYMHLCTECTEDTEGVLNLLDIEFFWDSEQRELFVKER